MIHKTFSFIRGKSSQIYSFFTGVLITVAVVLGITIYQKSQTPAPQKPVPSKNTPSQDSGSPLSVQGRDIFNVPGPNASVEEKKRHFDLVVSLAKETNMVDIENCAASPVVAKVKQGATIGLKNHDSTEHNVGFDLKNNYRVPANSVKNIVADFPHGPGLYGYGCDNSQGPIGFFFVVP